jgi:cell division septation protein DedD
MENITRRRRAECQSEAMRMVAVETLHFPSRKKIDGMQQHLGQRFQSATSEATRRTQAAILKVEDAANKMIRKLKSGEYRLYSRKKNPKTGKRRNLGTFSSMEKAKAHERAVQYFKRH